MVSKLETGVQAWLQEQNERLLPTVTPHKGFLRLLLMAIMIDHLAKHKSI